MSKKTMYALGLAAAFMIVCTLLWIYQDKIFLDSQSVDKGDIEDHDHHAHAEEQIVPLTVNQIKQLGLEINTAGEGTLTFSVAARGKIILHPDKLAHVIPKVSGVALQADQNMGNVVKENDVMAILESREMADVKAAYLTALSKQQLAKSNFEREERLFHEKITSAQDYQAAKNVFEGGLLDIQLASQKLRAYGMHAAEIEELSQQKQPDLRLYVVRSPIDGTVVMRHITKGEFVENTSTIYEVADLSTVWIEMGIYPKDLPHVKEGQMVKISSVGKDIDSMAKLTYVSPIVGEDTINAKALAVLDNAKGQWRPGVFVTVNIMTAEKQFPLVVPVDAVQVIDGQEVVFVVTSKGMVKRPVQIGATDAQAVEIKAGLQSGEQYVANKTFLLKAELGKEGAEHVH